MPAICDIDTKERGVKMSGHPVLPSTITLSLKAQPSGSYVVTSPDLPELLTEGQTIDDVLTNLRSAFSLVFEWYRGGKRRD